MTHSYTTTVTWTGNRGEGTRSYRAYDRAHEIECTGKLAILGSSDPAFLGDPGRYTPEELLLASLSSCHMLWYLHLCSAKGIRVYEYRDQATGTMEEEADGGGRFTGVELRPHIVAVLGSDLDLAQSLHEEAHRLCFIARSVNFPVICRPSFGEAANPAVPAPTL